MSLRSSYTKMKKNYKNIASKLASKAGRVVLRNLPFSVTEDLIEQHFLQFGDIREVNLPKRKDGKPLGCGFVQFTRRAAAEEAIKQCSGTNFWGRDIYVEFALPKNEYVAGRIVGNVKEESFNEEEDEHGIKQESKDDSFKDSKRKRKGAWNIDKGKFKKEEEGEGDDEYDEEEAEGEDDTQRKPKRGRIIVRNLSFATTEDKLRKHFEEFGEIIDIKILKKPNGLMVGCGFVEFAKKKYAIKAILAKSEREFLGRPIICDWALPKDKYVQQTRNSNDKEQVKEEVKEEDISEVEVKEEPLSGDSDIEEIVIKEESLSDDEGNSDAQESDEESTDEEDDDEDDYDYDEDKDEDEDERKPLPSLSKKRGSDNDIGNEKKRPRVTSNDVTEGCTIFIKNVPFSVTNEELQQCMEQIGPVHYAVVCIDPLTEHSRGTAFAKFKEKEDADKCLEAGNELVLKDSVLEVMRALARDEIRNKNEAKKEKPLKDNRHLYLVKEGVLLAGSPAARGVSVADMEQRLKIEQWKTQMLRNLNMFVSNTRLVVYNIPPTWTDNQVRQLFKEHGGPRAELKEARIMRDMRNVDANGSGKSKEYAFVHFTRHENALQALRSVNNNPNIFTALKRPIVTFSIENKAIHKIKQKRVQKSKMNNPTFQARQGKYNTPARRKSDPRKGAEVLADVESPYAGIVAAPGNKKLRSKFKLKTQSKAHSENVQKEKRKLKMKRKIAEQKQQKKLKRQEPKTKKKPVAENDSFSHLVDKYKSKLINHEENRKKWYE